MARKWRKRRKKRRPRKQPDSALVLSRQGVKGTLHRAVRVLRRGETNQTIDLASRVLELTDEPTVAQAAREVLAEAHFRAAVGTSDLEEELKHLDAALKYTPEAPRLHFYRGVTLWQMGDLPGAVAEFDRVAACEPDRPGLAYLRQLASLASGQPLQADGLGPAEANTLRLVEGFLRGEPASRLASLLEQPLIAKSGPIWQTLIALQGKGGEAPTRFLQDAAASIRRKSVRAILQYYEGVAAMRRGDRDSARGAWLNAWTNGLNVPWLAENLVHLLREETLELAQQERWLDIVALFNRLPFQPEDRVLNETISLAYYHLGYEAARAGEWTKAADLWRKASDHAPSRHLAQNLALAEEARERWLEAAEAWREMVRRRPRKPSHPDYLSDAQVAAIWKHVAECYERAGWVGQAITCMKHAVKYGVDDVALRLDLVDLLVGDGRSEAAMNELERILKIAPDNVDALVRLGTLYDQSSWHHNSMQIWRRVLAIDPENSEAREALVQQYLQKVDRVAEYGRLLGLAGDVQEEQVELLKQALEEVPEHPSLLLRLGVIYRKMRRSKEAHEHLLRAYRAAPGKAGIASLVLHELLHLDAGEDVGALLPEVRQIPSLLPGFWIEQGRWVLECGLDPRWAERFFEEALDAVEKPWVTESRASVLVQLYETVSQQGNKELAQHYASRIRTEAANTGAMEYIQAYELYQYGQNVPAARRMLKKARKAARKAGERALMERIELIEASLNLDLGDLISQLGGVDVLERILAETFLDMDEEDLT